MKTRYKNSEKEYKVKFKEGLSIVSSMIKDKSKKSKPKKNQIPIKELTTNDLEEMPDYSVVRFCHSTLLFKIEKEFILTDPIFSKRASPFDYMGPKRFHKNPIEIEDLPFINSVIISHDHYDHLDKKSIKKLINKTGTFYTSLKVGQHLIKFGVPKKKIVELNWWENIIKEKIKFICTPAQHFSGRTLTDRNKTLWSSWVIKSPKGSFYFGADGGYFKGFKEIASCCGPFDMVFLEVGAYNRKWRDIHMMPEDTIKAHKDLKSKVLFPIHNGTFDLSLHSWDEPFEKISKLAEESNIDIRFPIMGEVISLLNYTKTEYWWKAK